MLTATSAGEDGHGRGGPVAGPREHRRGDQAGMNASPTHHRQRRRRHLGVVGRRRQEQHGQERQRPSQAEGAAQPSLSTCWRGGAGGGCRRDLRMVERRIDQSSPLAVHVGTSLVGASRAIIAHGGREPTARAGTTRCGAQRGRAPDAEVIAASLATTLRRSRDLRPPRRRAASASWCAGWARTRPRRWSASRSASPSSAAPATTAPGPRPAVALRHRHQPAGQAPPRRGAAAAAPGPAGRRGDPAPDDLADRVGARIDARERGPGWPPPSRRCRRASGTRCCSTPGRTWATTTSPPRSASRSGPCARGSTGPAAACASSREPEGAGGEQRSTHERRTAGGSGRERRPRSAAPGCGPTASAGRPGRPGGPLRAKERLHVHHRPDATRPGRPIGARPTSTPASPTGTRWPRWST